MHTAPLPAPVLSLVALCFFSDSLLRVFPAALSTVCATAQTPIPLCKMIVKLVLCADAFNDTDTMYYFSMTDRYLLDQLRSLAALPKPSAVAALRRFSPLLCGFSPVDKSSPEQIEMLLNRPGLEPSFLGSWKGLGCVYLRSSELTNLVQVSSQT
eukprot:SAG11_NODE_58_length_19205_cov_30.697315_12_plen_155_part_00